MMCTMKGAFTGALAEFELERGRERFFTFAFLLDV